MKVNPPKTEMNIIPDKNTVLSFECAFIDFFWGGGA